MSPTLVNLVEDHGFISEAYYLHRYEAFWGSPKQTHESLCSKWTISYRVVIPNIVVSGISSSKNLFGATVVKKI